MVIRSMQDVTEAANMPLTVGSLSDRTLLELLIGHKLGPVRLLDDREGAGIDGVDTEGEGLVERPSIVAM